MEVALMGLNQKPSSGVDEVMHLLRRRIAQSGTFYIIIDALDAFEPTERHILLNSLSSLSKALPCVRIFLASRESLSVEVKKRVSTLEAVSMASGETNSDIVQYVEDALQERLQNEELMVGDKSLQKDIKDTLIKHADGMYVNSSQLLSLLLTAKVSLGYFTHSRAMRSALR
jgi:hypothetical protein